MSEKKQTCGYEALDVVRFIMAIFVVAIHTDPLAGCSNQFVRAVVVSLLDSAVPFFFLCTGFFLVKNADASSRDLQSVTLRQLKKTAKLYTLWYLVYLIPAIYHFVTHDYTVIKSILVTLRSFLLVGKNFNSDILWYMLSTIYSLAFISLLLKFRFRTSHIAISGCLVFLFSLGLNEIMGHSGPMPDSLRTLQKILNLTLVNTRIFRGFFFIPLGMLLAGITPSLAAGSLLLFGGLAGNYFFDGNVSTAMQAMQAAGIFILASCVRLRPSPVFPFLRKSSANIYFLHQLVMFVFFLLAAPSHREGPDIFAVILAVSLLLSSLWLYLRPRVSRNK